MIYAFNHVVMNQQGKCVFDFSQNQMDALAALIDALRVGIPGEVAKHVVWTFHAFYFPTNTDRSALNSFAEPLNAFLALLCLHKNGLPRALGDGSHYCARLQFSIRLRGFHHLFLHVTSWLKVSTLNPLVKNQIIEGKACASEPVKSRQNPGRKARTKHTTDSEDYTLYTPSGSDTERLETKQSKLQRRNVGVRLESHPDMPTMDLDPIVQQTNQPNWWR